MGFSDVKKKAIKCLKEGSVQHETERSKVNEKNLLLTGKVDPDFVVRLLRNTTGQTHEEREHDTYEGVDVHICKPSVDGCKWYVKFYFSDPNTIFISVHESE
ncbi:hypothetical protein MX824_004885 [Vibrio parahaemolyticus]|uniref:hypothetical protein n=1 Tax=Vibrio parahaemolyticus TaxID=670 RepID=UPI0004702A80|nr:hypothetical protein [Vibrio parahaemolyticus]EJC6766208.1 hypothetical protein [Vibrio parahaemolyticus]EJC6785003.1 hypothetical protein [Vibrio parahaemolyticus]EJC6813353.1 hypothetical protein [Vibrio parahaemolyticus]EJC6928002.1 hypothetical protein [Vibrio parahaemolyticus]EJC6942343.1 hypothetical protein [Vibrio parahaemolyticus]